MRVASLVAFLVGLLAASPVNCELQSSFVVRQRRPLYLPHLASFKVPYSGLRVSFRAAPDSCAIAPSHNAFSCRSPLDRRHRKVGRTFLHRHHLCRHRRSDHEDEGLGRCSAESSATAHLYSCRSAAGEEQGEGICTCMYALILHPTFLR
jgi:hypothetical protein